MICPKCAGAMYVVEVENHKVQRCGRCEGLWFDGGAHEKVKAIAGSAQGIDCAPASKGREYNQKRDYLCPVCGGPMVKTSIPEQQHIHIEACGACFGAFFDAGEFADYQEFTFAERVREILRRWLGK